MTITKQNGRCCVLTPAPGGPMLSVSTGYIKDGIWSGRPEIFV